MTKPSAPASAMERRFSARPHVGVVTHVEGLDPPAVVARVRGVLKDVGLHAEEAVEEEVRGQRLFNVAAAVPEGEGMELWFVVSEKPVVGCKLEIRLYHVIEESALADEYLASFAQRFSGERQESPETGDGKRNV